MHAPSRQRRRPFVAPWQRSRVPHRLASAGALDRSRVLSRRLVLVALSWLAWPLASLAEGGADRAVNPLTGMPLSLEQMHWSLEQAHLEEQLQASLLNRRKFELERQRLDQAAGAATAPGSAEPGFAAALPLTAGVLAPANTSAHGATAARDGAQLLLVPGTGTTARNGTPGATLVAPPAPVPPAELRPHRASAAVAASAGWTVVGVRSKGKEWCLLLAESGTLQPVCPGEWHGGHHVESVSAQGYAVDGISHVLDIPVARLRGPAASAEAAAATADELVESATAANAAPEAALAALPALQR